MPHHRAETSWRRPTLRRGTVARPGHQAVSVTLEALDDPSALGRTWRDLERRSRPSFFQSWAWIGCWLKQLPEQVKPRVLTVSAGGQVVGLAVFVAKRALRHGVLRAKGLYLNETGDPGIDPIGLEYNGFLTAAGNAEVVHSAAIAWLTPHVPEWDELHLGGLSAEAGRSLQRAAEDAGLNWMTPVERRSDYVDLTKLRAGSGDLLAVVSRNTRAQIRRALRLYEDQGPLSLRAATSTREALEILGELKLLHQGTWTARGRPGAFASRFFEDFHHDLVTTRFNAGNIQVLRVAVGDRPLGCLYNLVHDGRVHAYQSGFRYDSDPRLKPGLVSHYLAIQHNLAGAAGVYDFMAGDARYKRSLGTDTTTLVWLALQRRRVRFRLERRLRSLKESVFS
jgi:CelD/BcsL family acetyltransferase involved in cellulose biosynthesis